MRWGETLARLVGNRIATPVTATTDITAIAAADRINGMQILETTNGTSWWFDDDSTAVAGPSVLVPDSGSGRWLAISGGAGGPSTKVAAVRMATTAAIAAYTRVGNVITANGNGAMAAVDGVTPVATNRILLKNGAAGADNGPYQVTQVGTAGTPFILTRVGDADASAEVAAGMFVYSSEGTVNGNEWFTLTTNDPITLNTTSLTFTLLPSLTDLASTANGEGMSLIGIEDSNLRITATNGETALAELALRTVASAANAAAIRAIPAAARGEGAIVVDQGTETVWTFDTASAAGASDWVLVPDAGTGRWLRNHASLDDLSATTASHGMSLLGVEDSAGIITATNGETALAEFATDIDVLAPGMPMQNRLRMLGAPGAIAAGDTVTIGADTYEFRGDTPPTGGNGARIWVYNGATSATARTNIIDAINGVVDAARIANLVATELMVAEAGVTVGDIRVLSAATVGGAVAPSATATACSEVLTTGTDIWDAANCYGGRLRVASQRECMTITLAAAHIAKGDVQARFSFAPTHAVVVNRSRPQNEAYTITGNMVSLTLAGAGSPNNQANDVIDIIAFA